MYQLKWRMKSIIMIIIIYVGSVIHDIAQKKPQQLVVRIHTHTHWKEISNFHDYFNASTDLITDER